MSILMTFDRAVSYLLSLGHETLTIKLGLENTETLLAALGNRHNNFPSVQIAGTNGKGSTAAFLDSIGRAAGLRTGLFTSPHLISITERIRIDGEPVAEAEFARFTSMVRATAEKLVSEGRLETLPTFFEHVTAIGLLAFAEAQVDLAILETGLGGRLDSTTAARAGVVAITPVAMDHEEYLGHTIAEIAAEKAAIVRPGVTAVIGPQLRAALDVIMEKCAEASVLPSFIGQASKDSQLPARYRERFCTVRCGEATPDGRCWATFETPHGTYERVLVGLRGRHQIDNAATAIALAEALRERGFRISRDQIIHGLENAKHPGRLELWERTPPILFDGAHNPASARALRNYLDEFVSQPVTMIFGAMRDKPLDQLAEILFPKARDLILTGIENPRAALPAELKAARPNVSARWRLHEASSPLEALRIAREITRPDDLIVITGSLYLIGEAQRILQRPTAAVAHEDLRH